MIIIKKYGIWLCLALTLLASYWTATQESDDEVLLAAPQSRHTSLIELPKESQNVSGSNSAAPMQRPTINDSSINLFSVLIPPEALAENESMVEATQAPANPYSYAGKVIEGGQVIVFLTDGTNNHVVKAGDMIDGAWKVHAIRPPQLILKYVPLETEVNIEIGSLG